MRRRFQLISLLAAALLCLGGCAAEAPEKTEETDGATLAIVTSFYPMYVLTANVTDGVEGISLTNMAEQQTGCLHDYQLLPADMKALEKADVFVINGAGMESFMSRVSEQFTELQVITASEGVEMIQDASGEENAHVWLDPVRAAQQVRNIAAGLAQADPEHAKAYEANGEAYASRLTSLGNDLRAQLADVKSREIITFHEAFPYFAEEFDLHIVKVVNREPDSQPSAKELADTIRLIESTDVKAVFAEPQYSTDAAQIIAQESGATVYLLDPVVTGGNDKDAYLRAMEQNMEVLKEALGGA